MPFTKKLKGNAALGKLPDGKFRNGHRFEQLHIFFGGFTVCRAGTKHRFKEITGIPLCIDHHNQICTVFGDQCLVVNIGRSEREQKNKQYAILAAQNNLDNLFKTYFGLPG